MNPGEAAGAMEQGVPAGSGAGEGRYYTATPSPTLQAVKRNINHISGVNLGLRVSEFVLSVIAFCSMAAANQNGAVFSNFTAYSFLLSVNVLVVLYTLGQMILTVMALVSGKAPDKLYLFITFACDQLCALLLMAAGAAGAAVAMVIDHSGVLDVSGNGCIDGHVTVFCGHAEAAVAFTFLSFFCMLVSLLITVYSVAPYLIL